MSEQYNSEQYRAKFVDQVEHDLQKRCLRWFKQQYPSMLIASVPNAGKRSRYEQQQAKGEGITAGFPDLQLVYPSSGHEVLYIEMKTVKGEVSPAQERIHAYLRELGYALLVPKTFEEFQKGVLGYLNG